MQTSLAAVNGAQLYYEVAGDGAPVVLIHAGIADCRMWDSQIEVFSQRYRTIRYDMRGFGRSSPAHERYSPREDLRALLDALNIRRATVVGLSLGGGLARDFTLEFGERVSSVVLVAASLPGLIQPPADLVARWNDILRAVADGDLDRAVPRCLALWLDGPERREGCVGGPAREQMAEMARAALPQLLPEISGYVVPVEPPPIDRLGEIDVPALVVWGDHDLASVQAGSQAMASRIRSAEHAIFTDVAHMVNLERPAEFNELVLEFLQRVH